jgi:hypothetical protein
MKFNTFGLEFKRSQLKIQMIDLDGFNRKRLRRQKH